MARIVALGGGEIGRPGLLHADLIGEGTLLDEIPDRLGMGEGPVVLVVGDVSKRVDTEDERELSVALGHDGARLAAKAR